MKQKNIIQRVILSLLLVASTMGARAEWTDFFNSKDYGRNYDVSGKTLSANTNEKHCNIVFEKCKTSGAGNIFELEKGTGLTINASYGYSIREVVLEDTEGGDDWDEGGLNRIGSYSDNSYSMKFVKESGSQPDDNNIVFRNYNAPARSFRIVGHNMGNKGQLKMRRITVILVNDGVKYFQNTQHYRYALGTPFAPTILGYNPATPGYNSSNANVATYNNGLLTPLRNGTTTITATYSTTANCSGSVATAQVTVMRNPVTMTWNQDALPDGALIRTMGKDKQFSIAKFGAKVTIADGKWNFEPYYGNSFTSSNTAALTTYYDGTDGGRLYFGGTAGTATITLQQDENDFYTAATLTRTFIVMRSDEQGTILIRDLNEYKLFASLINDKGLTDLNARLEDNIDLGADITMIGTNTHPYIGTFDGQGHTLTIGWNASRTDNIAPIQYVKNATIKNLYTKGKITTDGRKVSGLIGSVVGTTTISGCISEVDIISNYRDGSCGAAGLVAENAYKRGNLTITDCMVKGKIESTTEAGRRGMSGFVYSQDATCTLNNCLYLGKGNGELWAKTFAHSATLNNCYYLNTCGEAQGESITTKQLTSGEVSNKLQNGRNEIVWGQTIGTDAQPLLTSDAVKRVYKVSFKQGEKEIATRYANSGKTVTLPTVQGIMGEVYDSHHYYTLAFSGNFSASTTVSADITVPVTFIEKEYYEIVSKDDWKEFCDLQKNMSHGLNGKLMTDINLGTVSGSEVLNMTLGLDKEHAYSGTLDGNGHQITLDWTGNDADALIFSAINATIRNLRVKGKLTSQDKMAGIMVYAYGTINISNCSTDIDFTSHSANSGNVGGMIYFIQPNANVTISDCVVSSSFTGTTDANRKGYGGIARDNYGTCTLNNCLYIGTNNVTIWSYTFAPSAILNNCYYLNTCGDTQGMQVTEKQLKNGHVVKLLQANRTDQCYWAQKLGEMPSIFDVSRVSNENYVYWNKDQQQWYCNDLTIKDYTAIGLDFNAKQALHESYVHGGKLQTIWLPYDWSGDSNIKVYTLSSVNKSKGVAYFAEHTGTCKANHPYIVYYDADYFYSMLLPMQKNTTVKAEPDTPCSFEQNGWQFTASNGGLTNAEAAGLGAYILQSDGKWHKVTTANTAATIPAYRGYIKPLTPQAAKVLSIVFGDDTTTSIRTIKTTDADGTVRYYDLNGRYIGNTLDGQPRGIYIKNGKKITKK
jgi:hypothetical protein